MYSPSQSPLRLNDEQIVRTELRQGGIQGNIIITLAELEENAPQEPPELVLDLTVADYRGKEVDPIISFTYDRICFFPHVVYHC